MGGTRHSDIYYLVTSSNPPQMIPLLNRQNSQCDGESLMPCHTCCIFLGQYDPLKMGAWEPQDNVSGLPICRDKDIMGQGSTNQRPW